MFLDNLAKLAHQECIFFELKTTVAFSLRVVSIVDGNLVLLVVGLQDLALVLLKEVDNEERVLEADEEVALVRQRLLRIVLLIRDRLNTPVPALVTLINLFLELLFRVAARNVLDMQVRPKIQALLNALNLHWLVDATVWHAIRRCRTVVLGTASAIGQSVSFLVRSRRQRTHIARSRDRHVVT